MAGRLLQKGASPCPAAAVPERKCVSAGGVEAVVCAKSIQDGFVHQTIGTKEADAECDLNYCIGAPVETDVKLAMSNSLGFGGHNAVLLFQKYE